MIQNTNSALEDTAATSDFGYITVRDTLTEILRAGAQKMLRAAIQKEVADYMNERTDITDKNGRRLVVRNDECDRIPVQPSSPGDRTSQKLARRNHASPLVRLGSVASRTRLPENPRLQRLPQLSDALSVLVLDNVSNS